VTLKAWFWILLLAALGALATFAIPRWEGRGPVVSGLSGLTVGKTPTDLEIQLEDDGAGLRQVEIRLMSAAGSKTLLTKTFPGSVLTGGTVALERISLRLDPDELDLPDGDATLTAVVFDWSLRGGFGGNRTETKATLLVDTVPPRVAAISGLTYVHRGGSAAAVYQVGTDATRDGVRVGDAFFPGHDLPEHSGEGGLSGGGPVRIAIFAVPVDASGDPAIRIVASDAAGNAREASFAVRLVERAFKARELPLSQRFLEQRAIPLATANGFRDTDPAQAFRDVNETLRERNERRIREVLSGEPAPHRFRGRFEQMRGSQVTSRFAERRRYVLDGEVISNATHYGFDLASTAGAKITAANAGVVVLAEDVGIYGNCVIVDHGLGVRSLYGHLSTIEVSVGDAVETGDVLGRSGMTGLAGGDHLHFAILVGDVYVDPMEWWDPRWVQSHIEVRLSAGDR
jgi:murein DD-endopeptidase MepM/ murein hydrolase activator NlpD